MIALQRTDNDQLWAQAPPTPSALRRLRQRWGRHGPPPRATTMAGWAVLPLRLFLGGTFTFAGLQKLANPSFFDKSDPTGIQSQLASAARISPIHGLIAHLVGAAVPIGVVISLGELAVGVATLVGLWSRIAAVGGMLLSFSLFLTVSFHSSPYYTGSDIVFVFAWTPLLVAGAGGVLAADAWLADKARASAGLLPAILVPTPFEAVQRVCGSYDEGTCRARGGGRCEPAPCPYLDGSVPAPSAAVPGTMNRRSFTLQGAAAAAVAGVALVAAGLAAALGRAAGGTKGKTSSIGSGTLATNPPSSSPVTSLSPTTAPTSSPTTGVGGSPSTTIGAVPAGTVIGEAAAVPVGGSASFTAPGSGDPALVVQPVAGSFAAFDAVCPHEGCIVGYSSSAKRFICPCHGSQFNERTGARLAGPAPHGLTRLHVQKGPDGKLYVT